jgi:organic radical activating enzyme
MKKLMTAKRKYTDEPGSDKGAIHLMINRTCTNSCPLCCNNQYDLDTVPVATVEELKAAHTVMLTGGDPFYVDGITSFCSHLRHDYPNVKQLYIYTSGDMMYLNEDIISHPDRIFSLVDGINFSPKSKYDYVSIKRMLMDGGFAIDFFFHVRSNRIILMPNDFMTRKEQEEYIESLPLKGLAFYGAKFEVEYREWQEEFQPNGGVWRRLPVFL